MKTRDNVAALRFMKKALVVRITQSDHHGLPPLSVYANIHNHSHGEFLVKARLA